MKAATRVLPAVLLAFFATGAFAHKPSDSYLAISVEGTDVHGQWDIALRDLDFAIGLDDNGDGNITWGEVKAHQAEIAAYALARLKLRSGGADCPDARSSNARRPVVPMAARSLETGFNSVSRTSESAIG